MTIPEPVSLDAVRIVPMRRRHLRSVMRIESSVYPRPWSLGLFASELAQRGDRAYLVAKVGTAVAGYAGLMVVGSDAHITTVAVDSERRRQGIATRLVHSLMRLAVKQGCTGVTLEVRMSNHGAQELYRRFGFVPAGVRKNYYPETSEDALVMWAHDVDLPLYDTRLAQIEADVTATVAEEGTR